MPSLGQCASAARASESVRNAVCTIQTAYALDNTYASTVQDLEPLASSTFANFSYDDATNQTAIIGCAVVKCCDIGSYLNAGANASASTIIQAVSAGYTGTSTGEDLTGCASIGNICPLTFLAGIKSLCL
jgi:hypothetical protein